APKSDSPPSNDGSFDTPKTPITNAAIPTPSATPRRILRARVVLRSKAWVTSPNSPPTGATMIGLTLPEIPNPTITNTTTPARPATNLGASVARWRGEAAAGFRALARLTFDHFSTHDPPMRAPSRVWDTENPPGSTANRRLGIPRYAATWLGGASVVGRSAVTRRVGADDGQPRLRRLSSALHTFGGDQRRRLTTRPRRERNRLLVQ